LFFDGCGVVEAIDVYSSSSSRELYLLCFLEMFCSKSVSLRINLFLLSNVGGNQEIPDLHSQGRPRPG
jgi:hypothetical protein